MNVTQLAAWAAIGAAWATPVVAQDPGGEPQLLDSDDTRADGFGELELNLGADEDLTELSLEQLMNIDIEVTSVSKRAQKLGDSAAAIYVLTAEDIRRSGASSIMEALRMVPGMQVARITSSVYAISSRGFNGRFANKMLVLIDGRSIYTPLFSGVFWDIQDVVLEDIERIEVIRGPGAALWGANAVNGVINIITKPAASTQGSLVSVQAGTEDQAIGAVRHGVALGEGGHLRVYGKHSARDSLQDTGHGVIDEWSLTLAGFRADLLPADDQSFTVQGEVYYGDSHSPLPVPAMNPPFSQNIDSNKTSRGAHLLARWTMDLGDDSLFTTQAYYDRTEFELSILDEDRDTVDLEVQHQFSPFNSHKLIWGLGYRLTSANLSNSPIISMTPDHRTDQLYSAFLHDEITLIEGHLNLILGSKFEHNDYTGYEVQPNARMVVKASEDHVFWGSVSRAVRTPSQVSHDVNFFGTFIPDMGSGFSTRLVAMGNDRVRSEELIAYEAGYRTRPTEDLNLDLTGFINQYDQLQTQEPGTPVPESPNSLLLPVAFDNQGYGTVYGVELAGRMNLSSDWTLNGGYTFLHMNLNLHGDSTDTLFEGTEDDNPAHQIHLRSYFDLGSDFELDTSWFYVNRLPGKVSSYVRGDLRLGWNPSENTQVSLGVQGLFHDQDLEFGDGQLTTANRLETGGYLKATLRF